MLFWNVVRAMGLAASLALLSACGGGGGGGGGGGSGAVNYTVTAAAGTGGSITPDSHTVASGATTSFTVAPAAHYVIDAVTGCDGTLAGNTYTTGPVTSDCSVAAAFTPITRTVTATAGAHGSVEWTSSTVNDGDPAVLTVTPDTNYGILNVTGCGGTLTGNIYTTGPITADCTIDTTFAPLHVVSTSAGPHGSVSPGARTVMDGTSASFAVTPDPRYVLNSITGCDGAMSGSAYMTGPVTADCTVNATFRLNTHSVSTSVNIPHGTIDPASAAVIDGDPTVFTISPDANYGIVSATGCSGTLVGATYTTGAITGDCTVAATLAALYTISTSAGPHGSITPASRTILAGNTVSFVVTPDAHYEIDTISGCGGSMSNATVYTTEAATANCTITATFKPIQYTLTATAGAGGSISPTNTNVEHGSTTIFTVTPDSGYAIADVTGCGGTLVGTTYTTEAITAACAVSATFVPRHTVFTNAGDHGTVTPASRTVNHGSTTAFVITPDAHYVIDTVGGCDGAMSGATAYATGAVNADCTVTATFKPEQFTVTGLAAGAHGTVSPATQPVNYGTTTTLTITPDAHYYIATLDGCGGTLAGNTFTTGDITGDCTVTATFAPIQRTVTAGATGPGTLSPAGTTVVNDGDRITFTQTPDAGYGAVVSGCGGTQRGTVYTTAPVVANCEVSATFLPAHRVTAVVSGSGGTISPAIWDVPDGYTADFDLTPDDGYAVATVTGCDGTRHSRRYTVGPLTANCTVTVTFDRMPFSNGQAADVVIGQPDFGSTTPDLTRNRVDAPYGNPTIANGVLYLGDYNNNRVLGFNSVPATDGADADFVLGAADFVTSGDLPGAQTVVASGGRLYIAEYGNGSIAVYTPTPDAATSPPTAPAPAVSFRIGGLKQPESLAVSASKLVVSDSGNNRVLIWNTIPSADTPPDVVLGQSDFSGVAANRGDAPSNNSMNYPAGVWTDGTRLVVLDRHNNRALIWNTFPTSNGQAADLVLGQADFSSAAPNRGNSAPSADSLSRPYAGVFALNDRLFIGDFDNARVLMWNRWPAENGQGADAVLGAADFVSSFAHDTPDNTTILQPSGLYFDGLRLIVGDAGLNRYVVFNALAP